MADNRHRLAEGLFHRDNASVVVAKLTESTKVTQLQPNFSKVAVCPEHHFGVAPFVEKILRTVKPSQTPVKRYAAAPHRNFGEACDAQTCIKFSVFRGLCPSKLSKSEKTPCPTATYSDDMTK